MLGRSVIGGSSKPPVSTFGVDSIILLHDCSFSRQIEFWKFDILPPVCKVSTGPLLDYIYSLSTPNLDLNSFASSAFILKLAGFP